MPQFLNIFIGLVPSVGYGCMAPFSTKIGGSVQQKTLGITLSCFILSLIILAIEIPFGLDYFSKAGMLFFFISLISGVFWYFGSFFELKAITQAGVSKAMPFSMVGQFFVTTLFSAFLFQGWLHNPKIQISFGMIFLIIIFLGILLISASPNVSYSEKGGIASMNEKSKWGFLISILFSVIAFAMYFLLPELIKELSNKGSWFYSGEEWKNPNDKLFLSGFDKGIMFPQSLGMLLCALIGIIIYSKKQNQPQFLKNSLLDKKTFLNMIPGSLQAIGNLATIFSIYLNGNAIASPLNQMSVVIATMFGIFYLKEKKEKPYMTMTFIGLSLITIGSLMSGFYGTIIGLN
ncbi:MAG: GRP family sugar transporter [Mycoplasmataceae bacterium]|nr:GRP family sugar transporter [Mycoplasmataceae bacterium]